MATFGTFVDDVSLKSSELNDFLKITNFNSVLTQGSVVTQSTGGFSFYFQVNKMVFCTIECRPNATGTSNNRIEVDLPVAAASSSVRVIGNGWVRDFATLSYVVNVVQFSTTKVAFLTGSTSSLTTFLGQSGGPNLQLGSGDQILFTCVYEAA